jgi:phosphatidylglycerophosphatase A
MAQDRNIKESISPEDSVLKKASYFLASAFGIGFVGKAPGTFASLAALPITCFLWYAGGSRALTLGTVVVFLGGWAVAGVCLRFSKSSDPSFIVVDEIAGQMAVFIVPSLLFPGRIFSPFLYICGFALFRLFDIWKPWHAGWVDKNVKGGIGVMLDDIVAAFYGTILLCILAFVYYHFIVSGAQVVPVQ